MKILIIGLGKLGYPMCEFLSSSQYLINAYDKNERTVLNLKKGVNPVPNEKGINSYIKNSNPINYYINFNDAINNTDICFITVPTPSLEDNLFDNSYILDVLQDISIFLINNEKNLKAPYIININSTVTPSSINNVLIPFLESKGLKNNINFSFIYNPYFVALGDVVKGLENPDMVLIGYDNKATLKKLLSIYARVYKNINYSLLNFKEAELTKLLVNSYLTLKISYSNMVKDLMSEYDDVRVINVLDAIGSDSRIGKKFLKPGGPYSGPCLPRDNLALTSFSKKLNYLNYLSGAVEETNKSSLDKIKSGFEKLMLNGYNSVTFAGVGYKSNTSSLEESFVLDLIKFINTIGMKAYFFDDYVDEAIEGAIRIEKKNISKYSKIIFLSYIDSKFNSFVNQDTNVIDIWYQIEGNNVYRNFDEIINFKEEKGKLVKF